MTWEFLIIFDKKGTSVQAIENPSNDQARGGVFMIEFLSGKGVTVLVPKGFGPRIAERKQGKGIRPITFTGVAEAVRSLVQRRQASTIGKATSRA